MANAMFYPHLSQYRIQNDTFQVTLSEEDAKQVIRDVLKFMGTEYHRKSSGAPGTAHIPPQSIRWLELEEGS